MSTKPRLEDAAVGQLTAHECCTLLLAACEIENAVLTGRAFPKIRLPVEVEGIARRVGVELSPDLYSFEGSADEPDD